ncbi:hypothetical protein Sgly_1159 [Syntrophobotulus glycolicus DSM 8271]|uniref:Uncharacterized protein n=1 Tax=Syntrophobotulus glycolicus (strain DSM 8271 / FlGlyR) TaxID=645991 RepID=F0SUI7_SYNGF|nr:hypothetical protein [Syntrophobotulus glycolicus]ADY55480.1 hypothetical protein Sgly_1159 [Syntrophobotulus glycolicus DSM 8271]
MNQSPSEHDFKRNKSIFYSLNLIAFLVLAYVYLSTLFFKVPFSQVLPELIAGLSLVLVLSAIYTLKGAFHQFYNPRNQMIINFTVGLFFGLFIGYFILYYSNHNVTPYIVLFTFKDYLHLILLALYIGLSICVGLSVFTTLSKSIHENSRNMLQTIRQRQYHLFELIYLVIIAISFIVLLNEFIQIIPTHQTKLYGMLLLSPTPFSLLVLPFTILEYRKRKHSSAKICLCIGILMFFWLWFFLDIGYLLFGP